MVPGRNLVQTIRAIVAFFAPTGAKQRMLDSMTEVVEEVTRDALKQTESRRVLDSLSAQPVILDAVVLAVETLGSELSASFAKTLLLELGHRAHELLPGLTEQARTRVRATAFLGAEVIESWTDETSLLGVISDINANRAVARRVAGIWIALLAGGSKLGISPEHGEEFAMELWTMISKGLDVELVEDCYWSAAHVEAKAAA